MNQNNARQSKIKSMDVFTCLQSLKLKIYRLCRNMDQAILSAGFFLSSNFLVVCVHIRKYIRILLRQPRMPPCMSNKFLDFDIDSLGEERKSDARNSLMPRNRKNEIKRNSETHVWSALQGESLAGKIIIRFCLFGSLSSRQGGKAER